MTKLLQNLDVGHTLPVACQTLQNYLQTDPEVNCFSAPGVWKNRGKREAPAGSAFLFVGPFLTQLLLASLEPEEIGLRGV
jgi:hypothetical protein